MDALPMTAGHLLIVPKTHVADLFEIGTGQGEALLQTYQPEHPVIRAILFDLGVGDPAIRPTADCGYRAAAAATDGPVPEGNVGAGAGATVGKAAGMGRSMKGGVGSAARACDWHGLRKTAAILVS